MGFGRFLCLVFLVWFSCSLSSTHGKRFSVGKKNGWVLNPSENYNHWAERNRFQVNDTLYFKYKKGSDSVLEVNKDDYFNCNTKNPIQKLDGGDSEFKFDRSGPFFFISGQNGTCDKGQKLIVIVLAVRHLKPSPAPHAQPPSGPLGPSPSPRTPTTSPIPSPSTSTPTTSPVPSPSTSTPTASPVPSPSTSTPTASPVPSPSTSTPTTSPVPSPSAETPPPTTTTTPPAPSPAVPEGSTPPGATPPGATTPPGSANSTAPGPSGNASHAVTPSSLLVSWAVLLVSLALMSSSFGHSGALGNN